MQNVRSKDLFSFFAQYFNLIPILVAFLLSGVVVYAWQIILEDDRENLRIETSSNLEHFSNLLKDHYETLFGISDILANKWQGGFINTEAEFRREALNIVNVFPEFQALNYVDTSRIIKWVVPFIGNEGAKDLDVGKLDSPTTALNLSSRLKHLVITPPINLTQGGIGIVGYHPLYKNDEHQGYLNLVFRPKKVVEASLPENLSARFTINIYDLHNPIIAPRKMPKDISFIAVGEIEIGSRIWQIEVAPTQIEIDSRTENKQIPFLAISAMLVLLFTIALRGFLKHQLALEEKERRFKDLATISSDWFWEMDDEYRFSYLSPRYQELTGQPVSSRIGKTRWDGENVAISTSWDQHRKTLENQEHFRNFEYAAHKPDGSLHYYKLNGIPIYDRFGKFSGYRGTAFDNTEYKLSELKLLDALHEAEHANRSKSEFLATMSHELRTPLNAILGFSEVIKEELFGRIDQKIYRDYANDIFESGHHLLSLINDLLDISAIEAGKMKIHIEDVNLVSLAHDCMHKIATAAHKKKIILNTEIAETEIHAKVDKRALRQIILNILSNAIKFSELNGKVTLALNVDYLEDNYTIRISDDGEGIAESSLKRITKPFERGEAKAHIAQEGTGLGLSIVKSLIDLHSGQMRIESIVGEGTSITIIMPRNPAIKNN